MKWQIIILTILMISLVSAECTDSDGGKNKYDLGSVMENEITYTDECQDNDIKEYFCSMENAASYSILPCVNGCKDGSCQLANKAPVQAAPETNSFPNLKIYLAIIVGIIIIVLYIYLFKMKPKFKKRKYEEY